MMLKIFMQTMIQLLLKKENIWLVPWTKI